MRNKYKIGLIIISILLLFVIVIGGLKYFLPKEKEVNTTNIISNIKDYNYTLDDRDTKYMQETFKELNKVLSKDEIDYEEYARILSKLFIIDFYTLNNKINKYDVGGLEYIYNESVDSFKLKAMDTIYKGIIDNSDKRRNQELPEVSNVEIIDLQNEKITIKEEEKDAIKITCNIEYRKDYGYDKKASIYLIREDKKLEIVKYSPIKEAE